MVGGGARAHSPELIVAHVRSCVLAVVHGRSSCAQSSLFVCMASSFVCVPSSFVCVSSSFVCIPSSFVCVRFHSWACIVVRGRSFPLVGMRPRPWAFLFVRGRSFLFVCGRLFSCACVSVSWCAVGRLVDPRGRSWCSHVVAGGVSFVIVGRVTRASLLMLEEEVGAWGYGTHLYAQ